LRATGLAPFLGSETELPRLALATSTIN
jgi:hypothetical protein